MHASGVASSVVSTSKYQRLMQANEERKRVQERINSDRSRSGRYTDQSERMAAETQRKRDLELGRLPMPAWARARECHLFINTQWGACGLGPELGKENDSFATMRPTHLVGGIRAYGGTPNNCCFQSNHLAWVTCVVCRVRADFWLGKGQLVLERVRRRVVVVFPKGRDETYLESPQVIV